MNQLETRVFHNHVSTSWHVSLSHSSLHWILALICHPCFQMAGPSRIRQQFHFSKPSPSHAFSPTQFCPLSTSHLEIIEDSPSPSTLRQEIYYLFNSRLAFSPCRDVCVPSGSLQCLLIFSGSTGICESTRQHPSTLL